MKTVKRTLAVLLTLLMLMSAVPWGMMNIGLTASAATDYAAAINNIKADYPNGSYFTVNGKRCGHASTLIKYPNGSYPCTNCRLHSILSAKGLSTKNYANGWTCWGFASYCFTKLFGKSMSAANYNVVASRGMTKAVKAADKYAFMQKAKIGDILDTVGHKMVFISCDSKGVTVYDANVGGTWYCAKGHERCSVDGCYRTASYAKGGYTGKVRYAYVKYASFNYTKMSIWHAKNYNENRVAEPTLAQSSFVGGVKVSLQCKTNGATIYYTTNGSNPTKSSTKYTSPFNLTSTTTVKAFAVKSGMNDSTILTQKITVNKVSKPTFAATATPAGYDVKIAAATSGSTIYYTTNGSTPTTSSTKYAGGVAISDTSELKAIAVKSGMANSDVAVQGFEPVPPVSPNIRLNSNANIGIGDTAQIEWNTINNALEYDAIIKSTDGSEQVLTTKGTVAAITLSSADVYSITVKARNAFGESAESNSLTTTVHNNVTVTFVDYDGTPLSIQSIKYGGNATAPVAPSRVGHTFTGWRGAFTNVTEDVTIVAEYIPEQYSITFVDENGNVLISKNINYGESFGAADIPTLTPETGYKFVAWVVKSGKGDSYEFANGDVVFEPSFAWANNDVPLALSIDKAERKADSTGYTVSVKITNGTANTVDGKLVSVIKTSYDQMLVTEITNITIPAYASNMEQTVNIACKGVGKVAEVYIVANDKDNSNRTGGAFSEVAIKAVTKEESATYTYWDEWSSWQTDAVAESDTREVETKEQYSYRDKQTTTSTSSSLSGWTPSGSSVSYGSWGSWSGWSLTSQTKSDTKDVETRTVYYYYHYCDGNGNFAPSTSYTYGKYGPHTLYSTSKLKIDRTSTTGLSIADGETKCEKKCGSYYYGGTKTQYRYRTRTKTTTYSFWKWGDWSAYDDAVVYASDNRQVQTRTVYRYRDLLVGTNTTSTTDIGVEAEKTGTEYTISGTLSNVTDNYAGKVATVMVYKEKNVDPTEEQMEYMTQITIGANNSYNFTFLPKEEISSTTGNYIVSFGVATADRLINNIEKIEAPKPIYDVTFKSYDGTIIDTQQVTEGENAVAPDLAAPEGYEIRWNRTLTNITKSVEISAVVRAKTFTVVFVDWANSEIVRIDTNVAYGSEINFPAARTAVGKVFTGWSLPQGSTVSDTMVIEAQYEDVLKTVTFLNHDGSVYLTTTVPYGSNAELPEDNPTADGYEFLAWSNETSWWNVTEDVTVRPIFVFDQTTETPLITTSEETNYSCGTLDLEATDDAVIYYTVDGTEPTEDSLLYEDVVAVNETTRVRAKAFSPNKNSSDIVDITLQVVPEGEISGNLPLVYSVNPISSFEAGTPSISATIGIDNPNNDTMSTYGYVLSKGEEIIDVQEYSVSKGRSNSLTQSIPIGNLEAGSYSYVLFAGFDEVGVIDSEDYIFEINPTQSHVHTYDAGVVTTQPTCTADGVKTYTCTTCDSNTEGHTKTETINKLGHTAPDSNGKCTRCGEKIEQSKPQRDPNACKWCGKVHKGFFQKIIGFFHNILASIFGAKY